MHTELQKSTEALVNKYLKTFPGAQMAMAPLQKQLRDTPDCFVRSNMAGHVVCSAVVLNQDHSQVLLIHHKLINSWLPPGGHYEAPGELWDSAQREVEEETGVRGLALHPWCIEHGVPLDIDTHEVPQNPAKGEGPHLHHDFRYLAVASSNEPLTPQEAEVFGARWAPVDELKYSQNLHLQTLAYKLRVLL